VTASFTAPAAQLCAFVLGCAVIHAARAHAEILTRVLAVAAAVLVLLVACLDYTPGAGETYDEISVYAAS
jgi:membrane associated rhomboid family serine protease